MFVEKSQSVHDLVYDRPNPLAPNADGNILLDITGIPANPGVTPCNCDNNNNYQFAFEIQPLITIYCCTAVAC